MKRGTFIVIDGGDGSGKATQAALLLERFKKNKTPATFFDFPRYDKFFGQNVAAFLRGEFGKLKSVSPYLASLPYALDRMSAAKAILRSLTSGISVIANRYVSSNLAHQSAKLRKTKDKNKFIRWIKTLEYKELRVPKEDIVIYLHVPAHISSELVLKKDSRAHLKGKLKDIHEADDLYQRKVIDMYLSLAEKNDWIVVPCVERGALLSIESIHELIVEALKKRNFLPKNFH